MQSKFTFKHLDYSDSLVQYTDQKLDEIGRFLLKNGRCQVVYYKDHHEFVAEVIINSKEKHFKLVVELKVSGKEETATFPLERNN